MSQIVLRTLTAADIEAVHLLLSDMAVVRDRLLPHCKTLEESRNCLDELIRETPGGAWVQVVRTSEDRNTACVVELCGNRDSEPIGTGPDLWGRGIRQSVAAKQLRSAFSERNLHRVFANCLPENPASSRVLEKIGMRKESHQIRNLKVHGAWRDSDPYAILRTEWETRSQAHPCISSQKI